MSRFLDIESGWVQPLTEPDDPSPSFHRWSNEERDALALAQAAERPLLVRGDPGTGKTQLARAAARRLGWKLQTVVIHPRYEPTDLLFQFDAVRRLADAQVKDRLRPDAAYWRAGPLWRAFDPAGAQVLAAAAAGPAGGEPPALRLSAKTSANAGTRGRATANARVSSGAGVSAALPAANGQVLLIDEIDKADSDLPNSLLEALGQRGFRVPGLDDRWIGQTGAQPPLVIITTNEERDLPPAFLRRCVVLNLQAPPERYRAWLIERGEAHHGADAPAARRLDQQVMQGAADQLVRDRAAVELAGLPPPGPAEYLDLLGALLKLSEGLSKAKALQRQKDLLMRLSSYAFLKHGQVDGHPALDQGRAPVMGTGDAA